jgi:predicted Zn-dependent protease
MWPTVGAIRGWSVGGILALLIGNPATVSAFSIVSEAQEIEIGRKADPEIQKRYGVVDDPALQAYVTSVGRRVTEAPGLR